MRKTNFGGYSKLIELGKIQIVYVVIVLFVLIPLVISFYAKDDFNDSLVRHYWSASFKRKFGFDTGKAHIDFPKGSYDSFAISYVKPGSYFEKLGFKTNDIPLYMFCKFNIIGGNETLFYNDLLAVKNGKTVRMQVVNKADYAALLNGKPVSVNYIRDIKITLPKPLETSF